MPTHTVHVVRNPVVCGDVLAQLCGHQECEDAREEEDDGRTVADGKPVHLSDWEGGGGVVAGQGEWKMVRSYKSDYVQYICKGVQWDLYIKDTLNKGHLSNEDILCSPNHIELYTNLPLN